MSDRAHRSPESGRSRSGFAASVSRILRGAGIPVHRFDDNAWGIFVSGMSDRVVIRFDYADEPHNLDELTGRVVAALWRAGYPIKIDSHGGRRGNFAFAIWVSPKPENFIRERK